MQSEDGGSGRNEFRPIADAGASRAFSIQESQASSNAHRRVPSATVSPCVSTALSDPTSSAFEHSSSGKHANNCSLHRGPSHRSPACPGHLRHPECSEIFISQRLVCTAPGTGLIIRCICYADIPCAYILYRLRICLVGFQP